MVERWSRLGLVLLPALVALVLVAACGGDDDDVAPSPTATPTNTPAETSTPARTPTATATASLEDEVSEAYLAYWDAYSAALLNLDASLAEGVAAGEELERIREEIEMLRADGVALRVVVEHDFAVVAVSETSAAVVDRYMNNSFYVDPETKEPPTGTGSGDVLEDSFVLERIDGRWVVVQSARQR